MNEQPQIDLSGYTGSSLQDAPEKRETLPPHFDVTMYVEARVGSENHRGERVRCLWDGARYNRVAEEVVREQAQRIHQLEERIDELEKALDFTLSYAGPSGGDLAVLWSHSVMETVCRCLICSGVREAREKLKGARETLERRTT